MPRQALSKNETKYWSNVLISAAQVFYGIFAASLFVGPVDSGKMFVVFLSLLLAIACWLLGWRIVK